MRTAGARLCRTACELPAKPQPNQLKPAQLLRIMPMTGVRAGRHGKRPRYVRITPEQFKEAREFTGKDRDDVAALLGVSLRTVGNWETGAARVPYSAYKLLRLFLRGDILEPGWGDYRFIRGKLVTPEGHSFGPGDMSWLSLLVRRAEMFSSVQKASQSRPATMQSGGRSVAIDTAGALVGGSGEPGRQGELPAPGIFEGASLRPPATNREVSETEWHRGHSADSEAPCGFQPFHGEPASAAEPAIASRPSERPRNRTGSKQRRATAQRSLRDGRGGATAAPCRKLPSSPRARKATPARPGRKSGGAA